MSLFGNNFTSMNAFNNNSNNIFIPNNSNFNNPSQNGTSLFSNHLLQNNDNSILRNNPLQNGNNAIFGLNNNISNNNRNLHSIGYQFKGVLLQEKGTNYLFNTISTLNDFAELSTEELRFNDYILARTGILPPQPIFNKNKNYNFGSAIDNFNSGNGGLFGTQFNNNNSGLFGNNNINNSLFDNSNRDIYITYHNELFGRQNNNGGLFGNDNNNDGLYSNSNNSGGLFRNSNNISGIGSGLFYSKWPIFFIKI